MAIVTVEHDNKPQIQTWDSSFLLSGIVIVNTALGFISVTQIGASP